MRSVCSRVLTFALLVVLAECRTYGEEPHLRFRAGALQHSASIFSVYYTAPDGQVAQDVARELEAELPRLGKNLQYNYNHPVAVEIYPDQAAYDTHSMDSSGRGAPASSGRRTIQMVSPRSPIRIPAIPYKNRLGMAVHELAHLFLNEINADLPIWLHEGVASFEGGADLYRKICKVPQVAEVVRKPPSIATLEHSYRGTPAADVLSFTFVDFVVTGIGYDAMNRLIRRPAALEEALGLPRAEAERRWHEFTISRYQ